MEQADSSESTYKAAHRATPKPIDQPPLRRPNPSSHPLRGGCLTELTERVDNSIKFFGDIFYTRAYRLAARRIGVTDYRLLVKKLKTAADLCQSMVEEFHQARTFVLEVMVVAILIIELVFLFRGKS
jgi:hypothetical protein